MAVGVTTLGLGIVAGVIIDAFLDWIIQSMGYDPIADVEDQITLLLDEFEGVFLFGDSYKPLPRVSIFPSAREERMLDKQMNALGEGPGAQEALGRAVQGPLLRTGRSLSGACGLAGRHPDETHPERGPVMRRLPVAYLAVGTGCGDPDGKGRRRRQEQGRNGSGGVCHPAPRAWRGQGGHSGPGHEDRDHRRPPRFGGLHGRAGSGRGPSRGGAGRRPRQAGGADSRPARRGGGGMGTFPVPAP